MSGALLLQALFAHHSDTPGFRIVHGNTRGLRPPLRKNAVEMRDATFCFCPSGHGVLLYHLFVATEIMFPLYFEVSRLWQGQCVSLNLSGRVCYYQLLGCCTEVWSNARAGYGMRLMEAIAYGCIPVIVQVR